ncbi:hypothetical protein [Streptomyces sp. AM8-1-1]|uniref:hypothetical protein n=1 Tax=Streptomyces sp. AM8-1-1 TaxID=3075825 RepID=UPI0028C40B2E|nr:hypothetical protein [Streptomyces sp. AM8-1-1]WNO70157.1 hypothetical protein RPQ07_00215 [Streptomyces sp. AM8-1-1]WNO76959.1 hypothetical protein RPQ07_37510 [Streptomyces sp. AM8-1-1]
MTESLFPQQRDPADPPDPPAVVPAQTPVTVPQLLRGRLLLQSGVGRVGYVRQQLDPVRSGLVVSGPGAVTKVRRLRQDGFSGPLLADAAVYTTVAASESDPFPDVSSGQLTFGDPLLTSIEAQVEHPYAATAAMTPTGYLQAEDSGALKAAVRRVIALDDPRVIFAVPVDVRWLRDDAIGQLIAWLQLAPGIKAVMLGGQMDPLTSFAKAVANLKRLLAEVPGTALLRADLAAFGALAHGAVFTAFGATSSVRHIVPPGQPAKRSKGGPNSPHVLFPELMDFFLGETLAKKLGGGQAPLCRCAACHELGGLPLDTFVDNHWQVEAGAHNAAVLMEWLRVIDAVEATERANWWQERCRRAVDSYALWNAAVDQHDAFKVPKQLDCWAKAPSGATEAADRQSPRVERTEPRNP